MCCSGVRYRILTLGYGYCIKIMPCRLLVQAYRNENIRLLSRGSQSWVLGSHFSPQNQNHSGHANVDDGHFFEFHNSCFTGIKRPNTSFDREVLMAMNQSWLALFLRGRSHWFNSNCFLRQSICFLRQKLLIVPGPLLRIPLVETATLRSLCN